MYQCNTVQYGNTVLYSTVLWWPKSTEYNADVTVLYYCTVLAVGVDAVVAMSPPSRTTVQYCTAPYCNCTVLYCNVLYRNISFCAPSQHTAIMLPKSFHVLHYSTVQCFTTLSLRMSTAKSKHHEVLHQSATQASIVDALGSFLPCASHLPSFSQSDAHPKNESRDRALSLSLSLFYSAVHTVLYCTVWYCTALHGTALYCTVPYLTVLELANNNYSTVLYNTVLPVALYDGTVL